MNEFQQTAEKLASDWTKRADDMHDKCIQLMDRTLFSILARDMTVLRSCAAELRAHFEIE